MRRTGTISQRSDGRFQIRYSLGIDPITGKRRRLAVSIEGTYKDAEKELRRILRTVDTGEYVEPSKLSVRQYLSQWIEAISSQITPKTHERYDEIVRNFLIPALGHHALIKLTPIIIQESYNKWITSGRRDKKKGGLAPRTRLHIHRILRSALKHAVKMRLLTNNPADAVMAPRAKKATAQTLDVEQAAVLLHHFREKHRQMYWAVMLAVATGMRRGEIVALRWKNVDFKNKTILVVESVEQVKQVLRFKAPKTEKTRAIVLPDYAMEELIIWKDEQAKELERLGRKATDDTFVCGRSWDGGVLKPDSLSAQFWTMVRNIPDFPAIRFHDLRHTHATQLLKQRIHPKIAQERLGHSTITTTLDMYSHAVETMQEDAVSKLDAVYRAAMKVKPKPPPTLG